MLLLKTVRETHANAENNALDFAVTEIYIEQVRRSLSPNPLLPSIPQELP